MLERKLLRSCFIYRANINNIIKRQMKAKTLNSVERISKIKSEIAAMECNRSVAAVRVTQGSDM